VKSGDLLEQHLPDVKGLVDEFRKRGDVQRQTNSFMSHAVGSPSAPPLCMKFVNQHFRDVSILS
jgi:hypothetical protein